jgi:hypothetical protein
MYKYRIYMACISLICIYMPTESKEEQEAFETIFNLPTVNID